MQETIPLELYDVKARQNGLGTRMASSFADVFWLSIKLPVTS
jgi:hypothetical protein